MTNSLYRKIDRTLVRQRHDATSALSALNCAAQETCATLRVADLANIVADMAKDLEGKLVKHVARTIALVNAEMRREKERVTAAHRRLAELESQMRALAKAKNSVRNT